VSRACGEGAVAGDQRSVESFCEGDVHGVIRANVVSQLPRTIYEIYMGVTVEIEVSEISDSSVRTTGRDFTRPHETSKTLNDFDVHEMRRMEFVLGAKEAVFDSHAKWSLQEKLQEGRGIDDDHVDSRSSRMTTAAGVFKVTRFRLWILASISSRVGRAARRSSSAKR
jgi:hypothetical protein